MHIDINQFIRNCKKEGPPALYNYSTQIVKRDYIMEPEPNPLQELQIKEKEESLKKEEKQTMQPNYIKETVLPLKKKIKMDQIGNPERKVTKEKSRIATIWPKQLKIKMKGQETVVPLKKIQIHPSTHKHFNIEKTPI